MGEDDLTAAQQLTAALDALDTVAATAGDDELLGLLTLCESATRRCDRLVVGAIATLQQRGLFTERGYRTPAAALGDLLGWERFEARRRVTAAEQLQPRAGLDGTPLPARLPATAGVFAAGGCSLRHVETIARALATPAAGRLTPQVWDGAEAELADKAALYTPTELAGFARDLVTALDQDGEQPDEREPEQRNELHLTPNPDGGGGRISGTLDAPTFDAVATAIDALSKPTADDDRPLPARQADALGEICRHALSFDETIPTSGGERPHVSVLIPLTELEERARQAWLHFGGATSPADLRSLACDARIVPVVLGGTGQPLDIGRATRTVPAHLRRAVAARDRGCAWPGCDRRPSWCECHHVRKWEHDGHTEINNLVMICAFHHRLLHRDSQWIVRIHDGHPEFIPPRWIDPTQTPRRKPALPRAG